MNELFILCIFTTVGGCELLQGGHAGINVYAVAMEGRHSAVRIKDDKWIHISKALWLQTYYDVVAKSTPAEGSYNNSYCLQFTLNYMSSVLTT